MPAPPSPGSTAAGSPPGRVAGVLKVVTGITAVLTLLLAGRQLVVFFTENRARQARVSELLQTAQLQQDAGDYAASWTTLGQALKTDPSSRKVKLARAGLAMVWLDHSRTGGFIPTLTALADSLSPALTEGLLRADSVGRADLLAHLGWADFLRWREGQWDLSPTNRYNQSLALDPGNPYAHAMLGHWLLWQGDSVPPAAAHFREALNAGRVRPWVRGMQLAALANRRSEEHSIELLRVANEMRTEGDSLPSDTPDLLWDAFSTLFGNYASDTLPARVASVVRPTDLLATFRWLFDRSGYPAAQALTYQLQTAQLKELAADTAGALQGYHTVLAERGLAESLRAKTIRAVKRLRKGA
jgi:Tfp pilus assembly protein PilF